MLVVASDNSTGAKTKNSFERQNDWEQNRGIVKGEKGEKKKTKRKRVELR